MWSIPVLLFQISLWCFFGRVLGHPRTSPKSYWDKPLDDCQGMPPNRRHKHGHPQARHCNTHNSVDKICINDKGLLGENQRGSSDICVVDNKMRLNARLKKITLTINVIFLIRAFI